MSDTAQHRRAPANLFSCQFLSLAECHDLCAEMTHAPKAPATAGLRGVYTVREEARKTRHVTVSPAWQGLIADRLDVLRPRVGTHFGVELAPPQVPQFLAYSVGDFFAPHQDGDARPEAPAFLRNRRISVVVLLNPGEYQGGLLTILGAGAPDSRFGIPGKPGRLLGFPSMTVHAVTTVTHGERFSIACWYESDDPRRI